MNKLLRSLVTYSYILGFAPTRVAFLKRVQSQKTNLSTQEYDELLNETPKHWARGILKRAGVTYEITGHEQLPVGPVLFISNHEGNFDIPVLIAAVPKPFGFLSKIEVRKIPFIYEWMKEMNCVFIDRTNRRSALKSIDDSIASLKNGHSLLLFPEGTRSKGNGVKEFKAGFVRIASKAEVPVIPIAICGTSRIMEQNNKRITPSHVKIQLLPELVQEQGELPADFIQRVQQQIQNTVTQLEGVSE